MNGNGNGIEPVAPQREPSSVSPPGAGPFTPAGAFEDK